ncbi:hypothetical protein Tco_0584194 [Tanacetum coccineum]
MSAVEVPHTLEYRGGQLNSAPVLKVENFTNWKKRFMCYIIAAGQKKPEAQWTANERKAANLDQRLKSLILSVLLDDQINSVINCLTAKSTWDDLILYHEGPSDVKESRVMDLKLPKKWLSFCRSLKNTNHVKDSELASVFDSPADEEDTSSHKYLNDLEEEYQARALLAKSKRFFKMGTQSASTPNSSSGKNKGLIAKTYDLDDEEVLSDENEVTKVKALMALTNEERALVGKESAINGDWTKISMKKVHTLLEMEDNDDRKFFLDYMCIDLNYVEEQRNNLLSKYKNLVQELNTCKEQLVVLKQAKLDLLTMQHINTEILKENQNLRLELKEITSITETWLNNSNKVNLCINEQILTQKKKIMGINQLTTDTSSFGSKDLVFVKSSTNNSDMSITSSNIHKLSETEDSTLPNQDTDEVPSNDTLLLSLKKLDSVEPVSGPKTIISILKSKSTFKAKTLNGIIINEPSSAPARGKSSLASKTNSAPAAIREDYKIDKLARLYIDEIVVGHRVPVSIISNRDGRFTSRFIENITESLRDAFGYKCGSSSSDGWTKSPVLWAKNGESRLIGPELVKKTTHKVVLTKEKITAVRDHQKSYADNRRKPLEFDVGDQKLLKVSPSKGVIRRTI